jgi:hypothetical protein
MDEHGLDLFRDVRVNLCKRDILLSRPAGGICDIPSESLLEAMVL